MAMGAGASIQVEGIELFNCGQKGELGRYGFHGHSLGKDGFNSHIRKSSIQNCFNRAITFHASNGMEATDNVIYGTRGHGVFFEDGSETKCKVLRNLLTLIDHSSSGPVGTGIALDQQPHFFNEQGSVAGIWVTNWDNVIQDNRIAGVAEYGSGIWYSVPFTLAPNSISTKIYPGYSPFAQPMVPENCQGNVMHGIEGRSGNEGMKGFGLVISGANGQVFGPNESYDCGMGGVWTGQLTGPHNVICQG